MIRPFFPFARNASSSGVRRDDDLAYASAYAAASFFGGKRP